MRTKILSLLACGAVMGSLQAVEFGIGLGGVSTPHYWGANEHYNLTLPIPIVYEVEKEQQGIFFDIGSDFRLPVNAKNINATKPSSFDEEDEIIDSTESYTRRGMSYLAASLFLGPKLGYRLGAFELSGEYLAGVQLGAGWKTAGGITKASIAWTPFYSTESYLKFYYSSVWADENYNNLYYTVKSEEALANRAEYDGKKSGKLGSHFGVNAMKRFGSIAVLGFADIYTMHDSVVKDSSLVQNENGGSIGVGLAYMF